MIYHRLRRLRMPLLTAPIAAFAYLCCLIPFAAPAMRGEPAQQQQTPPPKQNPPPAQNPPPKQNPPPAQNPPPKQNNPFENVPEAPQKPTTPTPTPPPAVTPGIQEAKPAPVGANIVEQVNFRGQRKVPQDTLRALIFTKKGDVYNPADVSRDFMSLWNTGRFDDCEWRKKRARKAA